ncbi:MAG TPA: hypothetical protein VK474_10930 [Chthoniobacterales bacterium]|nr:hypothetical protein [Chthoniobacterales bacterium]
MILRPRVTGYRAGELERRDESLGIEEDFFVAYGFVTKATPPLMHRRLDLRGPAEGRQQFVVARNRERKLLDFVAERGAVHPREAEEHFAHRSAQLLGRLVAPDPANARHAELSRAAAGDATRESIRVYRTHRLAAGPFNSEVNPRTPS